MFASASPSLTSHCSPPQVSRTLCKGRLHFQPQITAIHLHVVEKVTAYQIEVRLIFFFFTYFRNCVCEGNFYLTKKLVFQIFTKSGCFQTIKDIPGLALHDWSYDLAVDAIAQCHSIYGCQQGLLKNLI